MINLNVWKHVPANSATVTHFWSVGFALATSFAFCQTLGGGIGGSVERP